FSAADYDYTNPTGAPFNIEGVALHEFGHVLGLGHENDAMTTMNSVYPNSGPFGVYKEWEPFGNDRSGARFLYPDSTTGTDLAASPLKRASAGQSGLVASPDSASRGSSVTIEFSFSNLGTTKQTFNIGFYLSTDNYIGTNDRLLATNTGAWCDPGFTGTFSRTLTIPSNIPPGTYYLGLRLDDRNQVPETNGGNNVQPMPRTIIIN
ncbi:MAG: matrixin family metalloprotease, partial [Bryobacteraceae bacterium]